MTKHGLFVYTRISDCLNFTEAVIKRIVMTQSSLSKAIAMSNADCHSGREGGQQISTAAKLHRADRGACLLKSKHDMIVQSQGNKFDTLTDITTAGWENHPARC